MRIIPLSLVALASLAACADAAPNQTAQPAGTASAVFAGGCFWCTESDFDKVPGVISTTSGYAGGKVANPSYEQVSAGGTGHIESVRVVYDPRKVSYATLATYLLHHSDPLDAGGQFCDRGDQYRSALFVNTPEERRAAEAAKAAASAALRKPVVTPIIAGAQFYPAEDYHQDYYKKNPVRYKFYRWNCGRDQRIEKVWGERK